MDSSVSSSRTRLPVELADRSLVESGDKSRLRSSISSDGEPVVRFDSDELDADVGDKHRLNDVFIFSSFTKRSNFASFDASRNVTKISRSPLFEFSLLLLTFFVSLNEPSVVSRFDASAAIQLALVRFC